MYADRIAAGSKRSIKDRLNGNLDGDFGRSRLISDKRQRQNDEKWRHDLYEDDEEPQISNPKVGSKDLRLKLEKKGSQQLYQSGKSSHAGVQDLREKLDGTMHSQRASTDAPKLKATSEADKPTAKSVQFVGAPTLSAKKAADPSPRKKNQATQKKADSVDGLLQSLGLEKYSITFRAEEIDMTALMHMTEKDFKALGIPMGPRKKILLELNSRA